MRLLAMVGYLTDPGLGYRHLVTFMCFLGCAINYALRINLSLTIVTMVRHEEGGAILNTTTEYQCPADPEDIHQRTEVRSLKAPASTRCGR